jgi:hypothetical protein
MQGCWVRRTNVWFGERRQADETFDITPQRRRSVLGRSTWSIKDLHADLRDEWVTIRDLMRVAYLIKLENMPAWIARGRASS